MGYANAAAEAQRRGAAAARARASVKGADLDALVNDFSPLSGEWADEGVQNILGDLIRGSGVDADDIASEYENAYYEELNRIWLKGGKGHRRNPPMSGGMDKKLQKLLYAAADAARARGHGPLQSSGVSDRVGRVVCQACDREAQVTTKPAPNEIDIGGELVAVNCDGKWPRQHKSNPSVRRISEHIQDFASALRFLDDMPAKKLAHNTRVWGSGPLSSGNDYVAVQLHSTNIVTYYRDGSIKLDSGGWRSVTTKQRMNQLLPPGLRIRQEDRVWYIDYRGQELGIFHDGVIVRQDGTYRSAGASPLRRNPPRRGKRRYSRDEVEVAQHYERDENLLWVRDKATQQVTIAEWRDDEIGQMVEDGFFKGQYYSRNAHVDPKSVLDYLVEMGVIDD